MIDGTTISELFTQYYRPLVYFATKLVKDSDEAENIVAATFLKLMQKTDSSGPILDAKAFLYASTRNGSLDYLRTRKRLKKRYEELLYLEGEIEEMADDEMIKAKILQEVYNEIENLPPECRNVFKLMFINGLTKAQIAVKLGISPQTVLNQKIKAIHRLHDKVSFTLK